MGERVRASGRGWEGALVPLHIHRPRKKRDGGGSNGGGRSLHGRHVPDTRRPLKHKREHLAGDGMASVERRFGLFPSRIRTWAKIEVCSTLDTLPL